MTAAKADQQHLRRSWLRDLEEQYDHVRQRGLTANVAWFAKKGPAGIAKSAYLFVRSIIATSIDHRFDKKFGTDTGGFTSPSELDMDEDAREHAFEYCPTTEKCFDHLMGQLPIDPCDYAFVDFGSGKGRILILAKQLGFQAVKGVESCRELADVSNRNTRQLSSRGFNTEGMETLCVNALDYEIPDMPCVLYFFSPFKSPVIDRVVDNLHASLAKRHRQIFIVYLDFIETTFPIPVPLLSREPFVQIASGKVPAHLASTDRLHFKIFRTVPGEKQSHFA